MLVIHGGTCLTYAAADRDGTILGGGVALGVEARVELLARWQDLNAVQLLKKVAERLGNNRNQKIDPFEKDADDAVVSHLIRELTFTYRQVVKDSLLRIGEVATKKMR